MISIFRKINISFRQLDLFTKCVLISALFHGIAYCGYVISTIERDSDYETPVIEDVDIDYLDIPASLIGEGGSNPSPVEKKDWIEGTSKDKKADAPADSTDVNLVSGDGTDGDGYSLGFKVDKYPETMINFNIDDYFPEEAKRSNINEKTVLLLVKIDERGDLKGARIISDPSGYGFDEAAMKVLKRIRFRPGYLQGRPVKMIIKLPIKFVLE